MDLRSLVDVSPFLIFEATADSDQLEEGQNHPSASMDYTIDQHHHVDNDDAESCSYDASDRVSDDLDLDLHCNGCDDDDGASFDVVDDDGDEIYWAGHGFVAEKGNASSVDSVSSEEVMVMNEMEKNRLFWEACLAS